MTDLAAGAPVLEHPGFRSAKPRQALYRLAAGRRYEFTIRALPAGGETRCRFTAPSEEFRLCPARAAPAAWQRRLAAR